VVGDVGEPIGNLGAAFAIGGRGTEAGRAGDFVKDGDPICMRGELFGTGDGTGDLTDVCVLNCDCGCA
jgi:hypothetical protein